MAEYFSTPFKPGELTRETADQLNALARTVERLVHLDAAPPLSVIEGAAGKTILFPELEKAFPARIDAGTNPYTWTEMVETTAGAFAVKPGGRTGTLTAYEDNDNAAVPALTIVQMWPAFLNATGSREHRFQYPVSAVGGYSRIQEDGVDLTQRTKLNFVGTTSTAADDAPNTRTNVTFNAFTGDSGAGGTLGVVPAPAAGDTAAGKFLKADGTWQVPPTAGGLSGSGTLNRLTKWTGAATIGDSTSSDDGTTVTLTKRLATPQTSPAQITANQNDYNVGDFILVRLNLDADRSITGLANGTDGRWLILHNISSFNLTLEHQDAGSAAGNRIVGVNEADTLLKSKFSALLQYDATDSRWIVKFVTGPTGSGTADAVPRWLASNRLGDSTATDDGTTFTLGKRFATPHTDLAPGATQNDYAVGDVESIRLNPAAGSIINGITNGTAGRRLTIFNASANAITFNHENAGSAAANRFLLPGNGSQILRENQGATFEYDGTSSRWRMLDFTFGDGILPVGEAGLPGTSGKVAREDHVHKNVHESARVYNVTALTSVPTSTETTLTFEGTTWDDEAYDGIPSDFVIPVSGTYAVGGTCKSNSTTATRAYLVIHRNAGIEIAKQSTPFFSAGDEIDITVNTIFRFQGGDTVRLRVWHNHGSNLAFSSGFWIHRIDKRAP